MMYTERHGRKIYIYNLTKLKGNETKGKTKKTELFLIKKEKTNKAKPKKNETNEIAKI